MSCDARRSRIDTVIANTYIEAAGESRRDGKEEVEVVKVNKRNKKGKKKYSCSGMSWRRKTSVPIYREAARTAVGDADAPLGLASEPLECPLVLLQERFESLQAAPVVVLHTHTPISS